MPICVTVVQGERLVKTAPVLQKYHTLHKDMNELSTEIVYDNKQYLIFHKNITQIIHKHR